MKELFLALCLFGGTLMAQDAKVTTLMTGPGGDCRQGRRGADSRVCAWRILGIAPA